jgi:hypothetical protein
VVRRTERADMKKHVWTKEDDDLLLKSIEECMPLFEHFREQGSSYSEINAWDAVAGRMVKNIIVTGMACKRRYNRIKDKKKDSWKLATEKINAYERDISEATFDNTSEMLKKMEALLQVVNQNTLKLQGIDRDLEEIMKMWE